MMKNKGRPISKEGIELRRAIRAEIAANPAATHQDLRRKFNVAQTVIDSALTRTVAEWDEFIKDATGPERIGKISDRPQVKSESVRATETDQRVKSLGIKLPGIEQGIVKFTRKPAKMGDDYIFWIPRVYIRNGLVDTNCEYEIYLRKLLKKDDKEE